MLQLRGGPTCCAWVVPVLETTGKASTRSPALGAAGHGGNAGNTLTRHLAGLGRIRSAVHAGPAGHIFADCSLVPIW
jgi:hypothetical protein